MKSRKILIWLMGGMASGKSTVRRALCKALSDKEPLLVLEDGSEYTDFGNVACVGKCLKEDGCDGLDASFSRLKKDGGLHTVEYCIRCHDVTILEGSQTSGEWTKSLSEICKKYDCEFWMVLLDCRYWENYKRLLKRIEGRGGTDADMTDQRISSITSKIRQFRGVYERASNVDGVRRLRIDTEGKDVAEEVFEILSTIDIDIC